MSVVDRDQAKLEWDIELLDAGLEMVTDDACYSAGTLSIFGSMVTPWLVGEEEEESEA